MSEEIPIEASGLKPYGTNSVLPQTPKGAYGSEHCTRFENNMKISYEISDTSIEDAKKSPPGDLGVEKAKLAGGYTESG
jgi:hypothetical protein